MPTLRRFTLLAPVSLRTPFKALASPRILSNVRKLPAQAGHSGQGGCDDTYIDVSDHDYVFARFARGLSQRLRAEPQDQRTYEVAGFRQRSGWRQTSREPAEG